MRPSHETTSALEKEGVDIIKVSLQQSVPVDTSHVSLPQSVPEVIYTSNVSILPSVPKDLDNPSEPVPQSLTVVVNTENMPSLQSVAEVAEILIATSREANAGIDYDINEQTSKIESLDNTKASESVVIDRLNVPLSQSESENMDSLNQPTTTLKSEIQSANPKISEVSNIVITSYNQSNLEPVDSLPTLPFINLEVPDIINVPHGEVEKSKLIVNFNAPLPKSADDKCSASPTQLVEGDGKLNVPSAQSANSNLSEIVETLNVPTLNVKTIKNMQKYRKTKFDAIFDDDDDDDDTRTKLDSSLVEHTSVMRGAIPVLPLALAYFCLVCNVLIPGLGTIFSGMFCLCFGIPRFGVHDGAKHRIGSLLINLLVGCGQLFTVLFCLVGWGWSIWWGVIMVKTARKYRKLKAEAMANEAEAPPVTANNHTRA